MTQVGGNVPLQTRQYDHLRESSANRIDFRKVLWRCSAHGQISVACNG
jgi:hypothetical protein